MTRGAHSTADQTVTIFPAHNRFHALVWHGSSNDWDFKRKAKPRYLRQLNNDRNGVKRRVGIDDVPGLSPLPKRVYQRLWGYQMQPLILFRQTLDIA